MVRRRWEGDESGTGVADAQAFVAGALELVDAMQLADWVAEAPEAHLLPHVERACRTLPLEIEDARTSEAGSFDVRLRWTERSRRQADVRAAVFALVGSFSEIATYVRQRRGGEADDGAETVLFEVVTGFFDGDSSFTAHGHTVRLSVSLPSG